MTWAVGTTTFLAVNAPDVKTLAIGAVLHGQAMTAARRQGTTLRDYVEAALLRAAGRGTSAEDEPPHGCRSTREAAIRRFLQSERILARPDIVAAIDAWDLRDR